MPFADFFFQNKQNLSNSQIVLTQIRQPDMGPNCLPKYSADDTSRQRVEGGGGVKEYRVLWSKKSFKCIEHYVLNIHTAQQFYMYMYYQNKR